MRLVAPARTHHCDVFARYRRGWRVGDSFFLADQICRDSQKCVSLALSIYYRLFLFQRFCGKNRKKHESPRQRKDYMGLQYLISRIFDTTTRVENN